jgi:CSLREA domain-containing protein
MREGIKRLGLASLAVAGLLAALAPASLAATITVNSTNDDEDGNDADCTLREAIVAANNDTASGPSPSATTECLAGLGTDTIVFSAAFNGELADTINAGSDLPSVAGSLTISGGSCGTAAVPKPCVGLNFTTPATYTGPKSNAATPLTVRGLAITNALVAIDTYGAPLTVKGNWLGRKLDGTLGANFTGVQLYNSSTVGGTTSADRNVFAANDRGVYIFGGDNNTITGNYFSTLPDGSLSAGFENGVDIRIVDDGGGPNPATGNVVGGADSGTPTVCDGACNLIANATGEGIDLVGTGGLEGSATGPTTIKGNFIGLDTTGTMGYGNGGVGIYVGDADGVTVGGTAAADGNQIADNGSRGVEAISGATGLTIQSNSMGLSSDGGTELSNGGPVLNADYELLVSSAGADVFDNRFAGQVVLDGSSAEFKGNVIGIGTGGEDVGTDDDLLVLTGSGSHLVGGTLMGDPNTIGNVDSATSSAISIRGGSNSNNVNGNFIGVDANGVAHPNDGFGISVGVTGTADNNVIGGAGSNQENVISNSGHDAIQLLGDGTDGNRIFRNRGRDNGTTANDQFIDLVGSDGQVNGGSGPNVGIEAPVIATATTTGISGTSALDPGSEVRVYKTFTNRGDVRSYLGVATVDGFGGWSLTYANPIGVGSCVTANQDNPAPGSSELAATTTVGGGACDVTAPVASFSSGPTGMIADTTPSFGFASNDPASTFECRVDAAAFDDCAASFTTQPLADGAHTLQVRAVDPVENAGPAASRSFTVDTTAPQTTIGRVIRSPRRRRIKVFFVASEPGAEFLCKLDSKPFAPCTSPKTYRKLRRGRGHTIKVKAMDPVGNTDATPDSTRIRVPRRR